MKKNSYMEEFENSFPKIGLPITEEQFAKMKAVTQMRAQTRYVSKSEKVGELEKELQTASALYNSFTSTFGDWSPKKEKRYSPFSCSSLSYAHYKEAEAMVDRLLKKATAQANEIMDVRRNAMQHLMDFAIDVKETLEKEIAAEKKGLSGEDRVEGYLARTLDCRVLSGVVLPSAVREASGPKTAETDLLVISQYGVFVCEVKNYGKAGQTLEVQPDGTIIKKDYYGRVLDSMGNPYEQNKRHCDAVYKVLAEAGLASVPVYSTVIIANTDVNVVNNSNHWVKDMYSFCEDIVGKMPSVVTQEEQKAAYNAVQSSRMELRKFPIVSVSPLRDEYSAALALCKSAYESEAEWYQAGRSKVWSWGDNLNERWLRENRFVVKYGNFRQMFTWIDFARMGSWFIAGILIIIFKENAGFLTFLDKVSNGAAPSTEVLGQFGGMLLGCATIIMWKYALPEYLGFDIYDIGDNFHGGRVKYWLFVLRDICIRLVCSVLPAILTMLTVTHRVVFF